jgi:hypothetical protein
MLSHDTLQQALAEVGASPAATESGVEA